MSLVDIMIDQIGDARRTIEDGKPLMPVWVIATPEGSYRVYRSSTPPSRSSVSVRCFWFLAS
jgi:hypothetical protein